MSTDFFRRYIDILAEAETKVTPEQEMRARDIAQQMGVVAPNLADIEYNPQGVAIKINGDPVPKNLYGPEEQKKMQGAAPAATPVPTAQPAAGTAPAKPEAQPDAKPAPLGISDQITSLQKELKAKGADLGTFGPAGDGIDGKLGPKTRTASEKFPEIAAKYKDILGNGQAASPAAGATPGPKVDTKDPNALANALGAIEAVLAKYKIKAESVDFEQSMVIEHIGQFSPQEQIEIWRLLAEDDKPKLPPGAKYDRATGNWYTTGPTGGKTYIGGLAPQQSKWSKFVSKLGGAKGIGKKIAGRAAASAVTGPAAMVVGAGMAAWTAWDVGKALYDTFNSTELADLDPTDQEIVKKNMAVVLQYQKDPKQMDALPPELKARVERALKGLDALAVQAGSEEPEAQAASPQPAPKAEPTVTTKNELRIANEPVVPGQPLSDKQMRVMKMAMDMGNSYPPEVMAQYNKQKT